MPRSCILLSAILVASLSHVKAAETDGPRQRITDRVRECVAAWNSGDLDHFLSLYEDAPDTTVILGVEIVKGLPEIRNRYAGAFPPKNSGPMPAFDLEILNIRTLGAEYALVLARFHITMGAGTKTGGVATMLFHHSSRGWRVVNDQGTLEAKDSKAGAASTEREPGA